MVVRDRIRTYVNAHGAEPELLVLQNHGIFIAANSPDRIRELQTQVMQTLTAEYKAAAIGTELNMAPLSPCPQTDTAIHAVFGNDAAATAASGLFNYVNGPITPDHLVYAKAFPFTGALTEDAVATYKEKRGYAPRVVVTDTCIYGIAPAQKHADLALEFAQDGALVQQLAEAFGGIRYMSDAHREFIENWEVESYRAKQV